MEERREALRRDEDVAVREAAAATTPRTRGWLVVVGLCVGLGIFASLQLNACQRDRDLDAARYADCREGNGPNAYIRLVLERTHFDYRRFDLPSPAEALPILSCQETIERHRTIRLARGEEREYLRIFATGALPVVHHGHVVGSEPFPPPSR